MSDVNYNPFIDLIDRYNTVEPTEIQKAHIKGIIDTVGRVMASGFGNLSLADLNNMLVMSYAETFMRNITTTGASSSATGALQVTNRDFVYQLYNILKYPKVYKGFSFSHPNLTQYTLDGEFINLSPTQQRQDVNVLTREFDEKRDNKAVTVRVYMTGANNLTLTLEEFETLRNAAIKNNTEVLDQFLGGFTFYREKKNAAGEWIEDDKAISAADKVQFIRDLWGDANRLDGPINTNAYDAAVMNTEMAIAVYLNKEMQNKKADAAWYQWRGQNSDPVGDQHLNSAVQALGYFWSVYLTEWNTDGGGLSESQIADLASKLGDEVTYSSYTGLLNGKQGKGLPQNKCFIYFGADCIL